MKRRQQAEADLSTFKNVHVPHPDDDIYDIEDAALREEAIDLQAKARAAADEEDYHRSKRLKLGRWDCCIDGYPCLSKKKLPWKIVNGIRSHLLWQWFMHMVNLVNVFGLIITETDPAKRDASTFQREVLPLVDQIALFIFIVDAILGMLQLGLRTYMQDIFNKLDVFIILVGILDYLLPFNVSAVSALRVLRAMKVLRLLKFFRGISAIVGAVEYNISLIGNILGFMGFFFLVFGIFGMGTFNKYLSHRCVIEGPAPSKGELPSYYNDEAYYDAGQPGFFGEFEMWCGAWACPSNMRCEENFGNPNDNLTSFDDFLSAFLIMFQTMSMSTWYQYTYMTQRSVGVYSFMYFTLLILLIGSVVGELFCAVISFGFEKLEEQLDAPVFSSYVLGHSPQPETGVRKTEDLDLCPCIPDNVDPIQNFGMLSDSFGKDRGKKTGFRIEALFRQHIEPPSPLGIANAEYPPGFQPDVWDDATRRFVQTPLSEATRFINNDPSFGYRLSNPTAGLAYHRSAQFKSYQQWLLTVREKDRAQLAIKAEQFVPGYQIPELVEIVIEEPLKVWSEETIVSLRIMLHAQQEIQNDKVLRMALSDNDRPVQDSEKLNRLCQPEDDFDMPRLQS